MCECGEDLYKKYANYEYLSETITCKCGRKYEIDYDEYYDGDSGEEYQSWNFIKIDEKEDRLHEEI